MIVYLCLAVSTCVTQCISNIYVECTTAQNAAMLQNERIQKERTHSQQ